MTRIEDCSKPTEILPVNRLFNLHCKYVSFDHEIATICFTNSDQYIIYGGKILPPLVRNVCQLVSSYVNFSEYYFQN